LTLTSNNPNVYTDYFLSQVIALLKKNQTHQSAVLYMSDHGESLGEKGLYLHGMPYFIAPKEIS
jgi:lipid A ethanolaminephosphotransferase